MSLLSYEVQRSVKTSLSVHKSCFACGNFGQRRKIDHLNDFEAKLVTKVWMIQEVDTIENLKA
ncbi:hypothetical protein HUJ05_001003 [Dendroctonus ponderosae]|nr:hypothetical protein HUJ05_001003 [Dendroctonus ponderosae]